MQRNDGEPDGPFDFGGKGVEVGSRHHGHGGTAEGDETAVPQRPRGFDGLADEGFVDEAYWLAFRAPPEIIEKIIRKYDLKKISRWWKYL